MWDTDKIIKKVKKIERISCQRSLAATKIFGGCSGVTRHTFKVLFFNCVIGACCVRHFGLLLLEEEEEGRRRDCRD